MTAWLTKAGRFAVERVSVPRLSGKVNVLAPRKGVLHTTEGSFESALSVFKQHYAPHFMVGRDKSGTVRIHQYVPIGTMAAALENHSGGVETNSRTMVQIEIAGFSKKSAWLPDDGVTEALASLMAACKTGAGIPLSLALNPTRDPSRWLTAAGWCGHADVPENSHWDPGALKWGTLLARAIQLAAPPPPPPPPPKPTPKPATIRVDVEAGKVVLVGQSIDNVAFKNRLNRLLRAEKKIVITRHGTDV